MAKRAKDMSLLEFKRSRYPQEELDNVTRAILDRLAKGEMVGLHELHREACLAANSTIDFLIFVSLLWDQTDKELVVFTGGRKAGPGPKLIR